MTVFSSQQAGAQGGSAALLRQLKRVLRIIHRGIVAAKTRRLRSELMFCANRRDRWTEAGAPDHETHGMRSLRRPHIVSEKWDY